jgi:transcriptional regulator of met regulon
MVSKTILIVVRRGCAEVEHAPTDSQVMIIDIDAYQGDPSVGQYDVERMQESDLPADVKNAMIQEIKGNSQESEE